jgi:hypothetical protein
MSTSPLRPGKQVGTVSKLDQSCLGQTPIRTNPSAQLNTPEDANTHISQIMLIELYDLVTSLQRSSEANYTHLVSLLKAVEKRQDKLEEQMSYEILVSMEQSAGFRRFMESLEAQCRGLRKSTQDTPIVCLLVACCMSYDFNTVNVKIYNNGTIQGFWRACKTESLFRLLNPSSRLEPMLLIKSRSSAGFKACHPSRVSWLIASSTTTPRNELDKREAAIKIQPREHLNIDMEHQFTSHSGSSAFKDYPSMIASVCNYTNGCPLRHCRTSDCTCATVLSCTDASGDYEAQGASGDYEAQGASGGKYKARMVIFRILATINRFSRISRKEESH